MANHSLDRRGPSIEHVGLTVIDGFALRTSPVIFPRQPCRASTLIRWLVPAAVLVFGFNWPPGLAAGSSLAPVPVSAAEDHGHHCRCGSRCRGDSCCCGPRRARLPDRAAGPAAATAAADGSPCLNAAPCGDAGLPNAPVAGPIGRIASLPGYARLVFGTAGRFLPPDARCVLPARRASRLDEPPESPPFA